MSQFQSPPAYVPGVEFSIPRHGMRPGLITTIGTMSIIVGCLTLFGSFIIGMYSFMLFGVARMSATAQASATPASAVMTAAGNAAGPMGAVVPTVDPEDGLSVAASKSVADGVHAFHRLSKERRAEFEHFLQQAGEVSGFGLDDDGKLPNVKNIVTEDTTMPAVTPTALPTDVLVTAYGRVEIYDEGVAFMPADGSAAMRTTIGTSGVTAIGAGPNPAASGALTLAEAQSVISAVQANSSNTLNPAQVTKLTAALQRPGQSLVIPGSAANQFTYAYASPDGNTVVMLNNAQITLDASGKEVAQAPMAAVRAAPIMNMKVNMSAFAAVLFEVILSGVLAIYLVIIGIVVLRQSLLGAKLHWIYVALKLPLAIGGAIALPSLWYSFFNSIQQSAPGGGGPMSINGFVIFGIILGVLGAAYPVALLFALSGRTVRGYYRSIAG